jgi:carboxyl-terminal processing protease
VQSRGPRSKSTRWILMFISLQLWFCNANGQTIQDYRTETIKLSDFLQRYHVEPRKIDDRFSVDVYNATLAALDPQKVIFTGQDVAWLNAYRESIDDEINGKNWSFVEKLSDRYHSGLLRAQFWTSEILKGDIDWNPNESYSHHPARWAADETLLKTRLTQMLKAKVLEKIWWYMQRDSVEDATGLKVYEYEARDHVRNVEVRSINHVLNNKPDFKSYVSDVFLRAITTSFDPHSLYLSASDFEKFRDQLNTEDFYFGFTIDESDDGDVTIAALTPGGPAWKSGELQVSDVIVSMQPEQGDVIDLQGMSNDEVDELLDNVNEKKVEFVIRKTDGVLKKVTLKKERVTAEENFVRSFVLNGPKKVGYIHLPDFYTRWETAAGGSRCANDVAKEIIKLKKENIEGLIIDLRLNGGGSVDEALAMAGIFIDQGALAIMKDNKGMLTVLKDVNRGTIYDGPLVLMVNGFSASASEILAAAMQDYNRGLIVGSKTFGKATGQGILPLEPESNAVIALEKRQSFVKVTMEKLYRVTGATWQGRGVIPDIDLPDIFSVINITEEKMPHHLSADSVVKNTYLKPLKAIPTQEIKQRSRNRLVADESFKNLEASYLSLSGKLYDSLTTLRWSSFLKDALNEKRVQAKVQEIFSPVVHEYTVGNHTSDLQRFQIDDYSKRLNEEWKERLAHDIYLHETFRIMLDYIDLR